jgi:hypothetical protein
MDEALDKIFPRVTNPWEILDNKTSNECYRHGMMETMLSPIDIHEESTLELEKEDYISEHGSYFINTSSNPCSHKKSPESIGLSNIATHEIFNPLVLPVHKDFERVVVDAYVCHKYCESHWHESWDRHTKFGVGGETTSPIRSAIRRFPKDELLS